MTKVTFDEVVNAMYDDIVKNTLKIRPTLKESADIMTAVRAGCSTASHILRHSPSKSYVRNLLEYKKLMVLSIKYSTVQLVSIAAECKLYREYLSA